MLRRLRDLGHTTRRFFTSLPKGRPVPAPPIIKRKEIALQVVVGALLIFSLLPPSLRRFFNVNPAHYATYLPCVLAAMFAIGLLVMRRIWKEIPALIRQAKANSYCLCIFCGYCLNGLPPKHRCPECGTPYDIEDVKRKWSEYLADRAARKLPWW